ncbi:DUF2867 domain-containing protein [Cellulomonas sp. NPDC057328]|uniref:DUF2867 domain-containing protein n=1 Tax=Cellulomonas sp. NPDC057328 TaxID=3346101 RepID=UPI0036433181
MTPWSLALRDVPAPDFADAAIVPLPAGAPTDPAIWADAVFSLAAMPRWVLAALAVRQALVPLLRIPAAPRDTFAVDRVVGQEALIAHDDVHLDFRCGVAVDPEARLVRVTTAVRLHGWRGRLYLAVVQPVHPLVVTAMLRRAARRLAR